MKKLIIVIAGVAALGATMLVTKTQGTNTPQRRECVVLSYEAAYGPPVITQSGSYRPQIGLATRWTSRSAGAPDVAPGTSLGQAIADILSQGFTIQHDHAEHQQHQNQDSYEMVPQLVYGEIMFVK